MTLKLEPFSNGFSDPPENFLPTLAPNVAMGSFSQPLATISPNRNVDNKLIELENVSDVMSALGTIAVEGGPVYLMPGDINLNFEFSAPETFGPAELLVIVDTGFAFWNPAFRSDKTNLVSDVTFLGFGKPPLTLTEFDFLKLYPKADGPGGEKAIVSHLANQAPDSIYASLNFQAGQFMHGTAMLDLVRKTKSTNTAQISCIELPAAVVQDRTGDYLQGLLNSIVTVAVRQAQKQDFDKVRILLPFAFLGGPHTEFHPVAETLTNAALHYETIGDPVQVSYTLPMGNHRQDRQHAFLPAHSIEACPPTVRWRLHHDDSSFNTIELITSKKHGASTLLIAPPVGDGVELGLQSGTVWQLQNDRKNIGSIEVIDRADDKVRTRLCLHPTDRSGSLVPAPPVGDWHIGVRSPSESHMWILRDDHDRLSVRGAPSRASEFIDEAYQRYDVDGHEPLYDSPGSLVRRAGSASVMTVTKDNVTTVGALGLHKGTKQAIAPYSGFSVSESEGSVMYLVDEVPGVRGVQVLGNGTTRKFRFAGTSAASALSI